MHVRRLIARTWVLAASLIALAPQAAAQAGTDIWVAPFHSIGTRVEVGRPVNVTKRAGYDNQPAFTTDGHTVLFTSVREDRQADIWRVSAVGGRAERVTATPESEYSATPIPGKEAFSVIRVERDSTQRLWRFTNDGKSPELVLRALRPVGYHVWLSDGLLGTFVLGSPNALVMVDPRTERADTLARDIGRALVKVPGRDAFTFLQIGRDSNVISEVDTRTNAVRPLFATVQGADYHLWTPDGTLIVAAGTRIYVRVADRWDVLADFAGLGIKGITRMALSPRGDRIAFVAEDPR